MSTDCHGRRGLERSEHHCGTIHLLGDATDSSSRNDDVVEVADSLARRTSIPVVLKKDRVDAVILPGIDEAQVISAGRKALVDPELKDAVRSAGGIQFDVSFDTKPCSRR